MKEGIKERRKLERFELRAPAWVIVESDSGKKEELDLTTKDVSSDGAFLYTTKPLPLGACVNMDLVISLDMLRSITGEKGRAKVRVRGKVVRVDATGIAIQFNSKYKITAFNSERGRRN